MSAFSDNAQAGDIHLHINLSSLITATVIRKRGGNCKWDASGNAGGEAGSALPQLLRSKTRLRKTEPSDKTKPAATKEKKDKRNRRQPGSGQSA